MQGKPGDCPSSGPERRIGTWDFSQVLVVAVLSYLLIEVSGLLVSQYDRMTGMQEATRKAAAKLDWRHVVAQGPGQVLCCVLAVLLVRFQDPDTGLLRLGLGRPRLRALRDGVLLYVPIGLMTWTSIFVYEKLLKALGSSLPKQTVASIAQDAGNPAYAVVLLGIEICLLAPLAEEFFFRGMLQGWLRRKLNARPAFLVTAAAFGMVHGYVHAAPLAVFGLGLSWLREEKGLLACVVMHALHNVIVFWLLIRGLL